MGQQVNIIERVPLGSPLQAVVMSLVHNHMTSFYLKLQRGYCCQIWAVKASGGGGGGQKVIVQNNGKSSEMRYRLIINCTYTTRHVTYSVIY